MNIFCEDCGKNRAEVFLTRISADEMCRAQLCEECAKKMEQAGEVAGLLAFIPHVVAGIQAPEEDSAEDILGIEMALCESCGTSFNDFRKMGFLGCAQCYRAFGDPLESVIREFQEAGDHVGKVPGNLSEGAKLRSKMIELERQLERQIVEEKYEAAAAARDQIREIENILKGEGQDGDRD